MARGSSPRATIPGVPDRGGGTVVISSGFHKTHVTTAARAASDEGLLGLAITGAYPTGRLRRTLQRLRLARSGRLARLLERGEEIPGSKLRALFLPELLDEAARLLAHVPLIGRLYPTLSAACWRLYGRMAGRALRRAPDARIFHFRAGFGGASIQRAGERGMVTVCDHAAVHPSLLEELIANCGRLSSGSIGVPSSPPVPPPRDPRARAVLSDLERADLVLVNSEFVKGTLITAGFSPDRIEVVYLGVDDNFLNADAKAPEVPDGRHRLLFAGRLETLKGADVLLAALDGVGTQLDWELVVAGPVAADVRARHRLLGDSRVSLRGVVPRTELKAQMLSAPIFVLPSYAEGSARAAFEALACGCYVITTPNSGTVVEDGVHGALVEPGDADALRAAILEAGRDPARVDQIGRQNAHLIASHYRQEDYARALASLYRTLDADIGGGAPGSQSHDAGEAPPATASWPAGDLV